MSLGFFSARVKFPHQQAGQGVGRTHPPSALPWSLLPSWEAAAGIAVSS